MRISRTVLGLLAVILVTPRALAQAPPASANGIGDDARAHFAAGVSLLQDPEGEKVEDAYREFQKAYEISNSPKILGNLGFCAMRLERDGEAIDAYSRYLREVPDIDADERAQIVRDLQTLTVGVARLTLQVDKPGARVIDVRTPTRGERVTNVYGPVDGKLDVGVRPGHHVITAKLADHEDAVWEVDAFAASRDRYVFAMRRRVTQVSSETRGVNVGPWIMIGIGGAMLVGGVITGVVALDKTSGIESQCPANVCPKSYDLEGERAAAKTFVRLTDVLLIGGGIVTAGGGAWLLFGGEKRERAPSSAHRAPFVPNAGCGLDGCRASLKMVF